jgi:glycerol-3-phosphate dehydrogenase
MEDKMGEAYLSAATRRQSLAQMVAKPLDILVIGAGITGAGIALDAAARGYRVGLIERNDFASGTSSRSTKLVHGGIRYLPELDIPLVREALVERGRLLSNAPHLVHPLSFILPLYKDSRHPVGLPIAPLGGIGLSIILDMGLLLYDVLAGSKNVGRHRRLSRSDTLKRAGCLHAHGLKTGFVYFDAQTDDTRLVLAVLRSAAERGALLANYAEVSGFVTDAARITGVSVINHLTQNADSERDVVIQAKHIVNATGVWAEDVERLAGEHPQLEIAPSKGTHLVFARETLNLGDEAVILPETKDGRIIFIVPWHSRALVGTTDEGVQRIEDPIATAHEIDYLIAHLNRYLHHSVSRADILTTYAGYRPLLRLRTRRTPSRLSRTHAIVEARDGLLTISGGKLTTYRKMAQDVLDRIDWREQRSIKHATEQLKLLGSSNLAYNRQSVAQRGRMLELTVDTIEHLLSAYGSEAASVLDLVDNEPDLGRILIQDLPYIAAEVIFACRCELAITLEDVLARRTRIAIVDRTRGLASIECVATLMQRELGWSETERNNQVALYKRYAHEQAGPLASAPAITADVAIELTDGR